MSEENVFAVIQTMWKTKYSLPLPPHPPHTHAHMRTHTGEIYIQILYGWVEDDF